MSTPIYAEVDPTIDRTTPDKFGQTVNEGMNMTIGALAWIVSKQNGKPLNPGEFTEKEWRVVEALQS